MRKLFTVIAAFIFTSTSFSYDVTMSDYSRCVIDFGYTESNDKSFAQEIKHPISCESDGFLKNSKDKEMLISEAVKLAPSAIFDAFRIIEKEFSRDVYQRYSKELKLKPFISINFGEYYKSGIGVPYCPSIACLKTEKDSVNIELEVTASTFKELDKFDILALLCHEVGHAISGGQTYKAEDVNKYEKKVLPYIEGEAEYFVPECMKRLIKKGHITTHRENHNVDSDVLEVCQNDSECELILQSAKNLSREILTRRNRFIGGFVEEAYFNSKFKKSIEEPSFLKRDRRKVLFSSDDRHPNFQCRFDTIKNAYFGRRRPRCWSNKR